MPAQVFRVYPLLQRKEKSVPIVSVFQTTMLPIHHNMRQAKAHCALQVTTYSDPTDSHDDHVTKFVSTEEPWLLERAKTQTEGIPIKLKVGGHPKHYSEAHFAPTFKAKHE